MKAVTGQDNTLIGSNDLTTRQLLKYASDLSDVYILKKEQHKSLQTAKEKINAIVDSMSEGMLATDKEHIIIETNPVACSLLNVELHELIGRGFMDLPVISTIKDQLIHLTESFNEQYYRKSDVELELPSRRLIRIAVSRLKGGQGYVYIFHDITAERRVENARNDFFSILSHELRTPIAAILNFTHLLTEEFSGPAHNKIRKYLEYIGQNGNRLTKIVNELLQFAQIEKGGQESEHTPVQIDAILHEVIAALQPEIQDKKIHIHTSINPEKQKINGNGVLLENLFMSIIHNAIVFSSPNSSVRISMTEETEHHRILVQDEGIGIPAVELDNIFTGFYQVQEHMTGSHEGLGIGLALARHVVEQHNGTIRLESDPDKGTTCIITLPKVDRIPPQK